MQTLTKVYERHDVARQVVVELETAGFQTPSISLLANKAISDQYGDVDTVAEPGSGVGVGAALGVATGLLAGMGLIAIPGLGPVVAAGWLATTALGAGGIVGALVEADVPEDHAHVYSEAIRRGATLLSIKVRDEDVSLARAILDRHTSVDPVRQGAEYRKSGWRQFDPAASDYVPEGLEVENAAGRVI
ncbi:MAG TPA: hypothetical protein VM144_01065 [Aestuariivirga sp.]|nr:hypothetical protein [Aestuariivirga sp.]